jgi:hypothetical protein
LIVYAVHSVDDDDDDEPQVGDAIPNNVRQHEPNYVSPAKHQVSARYSIIGQLGIAISDRGREDT